MHLPNEIVNIIFSFKQSPEYNKLMKDIILFYKTFLKCQNRCKSPFHIYFFRLWLPIWRRWPENFPSLSIN